MTMMKSVYQMVRRMLPNPTVWIIYRRNCFAWKRIMRNEWKFKKFAIKRNSPIFNGILWNWIDKCRWVWWFGAKQFFRAIFSTVIFVEVELGILFRITYPFDLVLILGTKASNIEWWITKNNRRREATINA